MTEMPEPTAARIAQRGRDELLARLRSALEQEAGRASEIVTLKPGELERLAADAAERADGVLWRRSLAQAATAELGIGLAEAAVHPAVERAHELAGAPPYQAPVADPPRAAPELGAAVAAPAAPAPEALRLSAVHIGGIENLSTGDRDVELRFSSAGLDVLKRSSGAAIGHLEWSAMESVELPQRRGLRARRRAQELHVVTGRGRASFELPGLTEEQIKEHLEPMLARGRDGASA